MTSTVQGRIHVVPTLNIKDPQVYELAQELARRRAVSMTEAIRQALKDSLEEAKRSRAGLADRVLEIGRRSAAISEPYLGDDDLYDEAGLPK